MPEMVRMLANISTKAAKRACSAVPPLRLSVVLAGGQIAKAD